MDQSLKVHFRDPYQTISGKYLNLLKLKRVRWILIRNLSILILMWGYGLRVEVLNLEK